MIHLDTHVHVYDGYNVDRLCDAMVARAGKEAIPAMFLAERTGQHTFSDWVAAAKEGRPMAGATRWRPLTAPDDWTVVLGDGDSELAVFAARQIAAKERIEALGLFLSTPIPDGLPLAGTLERIREAGGIPVLPWGIGKWLFKRRKIVERILASYDPDTLFLGDSALRPRFWKTPRPMSAAIKRGFRVLHGSDPLPHPDEELRAGSYATLLMGSLDPASPADGLRNLLFLQASSFTPVGRRSTLREFLCRNRRLRRPSTPTPPASGRNA
jgi:hypothetical protein